MDTMIKMDIVKIAEIGKETGLKGKKLDNFIVFLILDLIILQNLIVKSGQIDLKKTTLEYLWILKVNLFTV